MEKGRGATLRLSLSRVLGQKWARHSVLSGAIVDGSGIGGLVEGLEWASVSVGAVLGRMHVESMIKAQEG